MSYEYDIFVSYRRLGGVQRWIERHFAPTLKDCLAYELDREPRIFFDSQIESGVTWPAVLGHKLARSRMLISLWSQNYLKSRWCALELAHMLAREDGMQLRTPNNPGGLIAICIIHDGETLPRDLASIQRFEVRDQFIIRMREDSEATEDLEIALRAQAGALGRMINAAPPFQPEWAAESARDFFNAYWDDNEPSQGELPRFTSR